MPPTVNVALKVAIVQSQKQQRAIARRARLSETRFSHIVRGRIEPTSKEKERIAKALSCPVTDLFPVAAATDVERRESNDRRATPRSSRDRRQREEAHPS